MDDDFNTPVAIAELQRLRGEVNRLLEVGLSRNTCQQAMATFRGFGHVLGLFHVKDWQFAPPSIITKRVTDALSVSAEEIARKEQLSPALVETQTEPVLPLSDQEIERKLAERQEARQKKDFLKADEIRNVLADLGIAIEDRPDGTSRWKR
jgi:cysteinyl-tRNA synthetase